MHEFRNNPNYSLVEPGAIYSSGSRKNRKISEIIESSLLPYRPGTRRYTNMVIDENGLISDI